MDGDGAKPTEQKMVAESVNSIVAGEILEMNEGDLEQVNGGTDNVKNITFGVQKDKMKSANKNAEQVKGLL